MKDGSILVVEPDDTLRAALAALLRQEDYQVVVAATGSEAHALLTSRERELPSLVLTDLALPGLNGFELMKKVMRDRRYLDQPPAVVMLTSGSLEDGLAQSVGPLVTALLRKSISPDELVAAVAQHYPKTRVLDSTLDPAALRNLFTALGAGSEASVAEIVGVFARTMPDLVTAIETGFARQDWETIARRAHSIKSSAANLGAVRLSRIASELEKSAQGPVARVLASQVAGLRVELDKACAQLAEFVGTMKS